MIVDGKDRNGIYKTENGNTMTAIETITFKVND